MKKSDKGITLIMLIIMIIMMLILVSVGTTTGLNTYKTAKITKFVMQMQLIQKKVDSMCQEYTEQELLEKIGDLGKGPGETGFPEAQTILVMGNADYTQYNEYIRYLDEAALTQLDIKDVDDEIIINFATREVFSLTGIEDKNGNIKYTQYDLPGRPKKNRICSANNKFR